MFGNHFARRKRGASYRVQNWVDEGMEMVRDHATQPAIWGAALSVAVCALLGYGAYKNRDELPSMKVVSARAQKAVRRDGRVAKRTVRSAKKKAAALKTHP